MDRAATLTQTHWRLAISTARGMASPRYWDIAESAATEALWVCARDWSGAGPFAAYAVPRIRWRVLDALRRWRGGSRTGAAKRRSETMVWDVVPERPVPSAEDEAIARATLARLAQRRYVREIAAGVAAGLSQTDIARRIGVDQSRVAQVIGECRRAAA